jgi:hypothetical protein
MEEAPAEKNAEPAKLTPRGKPGRKLIAGPRLGPVVTTDMRGGVSPARHTTNHLGEPMAITAALVKELRDKTGAGMMDAKKALTETDGDMDAAVDWLRTKGLAKAAKKSGRTAAEGLVAVASTAAPAWRSR